MEGSHAIKTGHLVSLSEQQLVDCSTQNHGCQGGLMDWAFAYTKTNPLETESEYPYVAYDGTCTYDRKEGVVSAKSYHDVTPNNKDQLKAAVNKEPVSVAIEADQAVF
jgi:Papain family cysteine protease